MNESKQKILCIDDDNDTCVLVDFVLKEEGYDITSCNSAEDGLFQARKGNFAAIILDNRFERTDGVKICEEIRSFNSIVPIIFLSGEARPAEIEKALAAGANAYLVKPNDFEKLTETIVGLTGENRTKAVSN